MTRAELAKELEAVHLDDAPFPMPVPKITPFLLLVVALAVAGCERTDPLDRKVPADTSQAYQQWRNRHLDDLTPDQSQAFDTATEELQLKAQAEGTRGTDAIDAAMRKGIDGKTVREVLQAGFGWKLARLEEQRNLYDTMLKTNAQLTTRPGDTASADFLRDRRDSQVAQRNSFDQQIDDVEMKMRELGLKPEPAKLSTPAANAAQQNAPQPDATPPASAPTPTTPSTSQK